MEPEIVKHAANVFASLVPTLGALGTVWFGFCLNRRQSSRQKEADFAERQIKEFYSPMICLHNQIRTMSELRENVNLACNLAWSDIIGRYPTQGERTKYFDPERYIDNENERFKNQILPLYDRMQTIFTEHLWLADESTQDWQEEFNRFVMLWHRHLEETLPREAMQHLDIDHREEKLAGFYRNLENEFKRLREIAAGRNPKHMPFVTRLKNCRNRRYEPITTVTMDDFIEIESENERLKRGKDIETYEEIIISATAIK